MPLPIICNMNISTITCIDLVEAMKQSPVNIDLDKCTFVILELYRGVNVLLCKEAERTLLCIHLSTHAPLDTCTPRYMHPSIHAPLDTCTPRYMHPSIHAPLDTCTPRYMHPSIHAPLDTCTEYIEGWKQEGSKCYCIKNKIKTLCSFTFQYKLRLSHS